MKNVIIKPSMLCGNVKIPSSKSIGHRAIICAGLGHNISNIHNVSYSVDIKATSAGMESLGSAIICKESSMIVKGVGNERPRGATIKCKESGSTLRFLLPLTAALGIPAAFYGDGKLAERPLKPYLDIFQRQGIKYKKKEGNLPLSIDGKLQSGRFYISGGISSQFISGLLFSLPIVQGDSQIEMTSELQSKPYVDLTIDILSHFGIKIENNKYKEFTIKGDQKYISRDYTVEGDYSQASFWLAANVLGGDVKCIGLNENTLQGDKEIIDIIDRMFLSGKNSDLIIDAADCPDLVPVIAVLGALREGKTEIIRAGRLRLKESDRLTAITSELKKLEANIEEKNDGLVIEGKNGLMGGIVESWGDHRIAMALAISAVKCKRPLIIKGADCVNKSYPDFWKDFKELGGAIDEWVE